MKTNLLQTLCAQLGIAYSDTTRLVTFTGANPDELEQQMLDWRLSPEMTRPGGKGFVMRHQDDDTSEGVIRYCVYTPYDGEEN